MHSFVKLFWIPTAVLCLLTVANGRKVTEIVSTDRCPKERCSGRVIGINVTPTFINPPTAIDASVKASIPWQMSENDFWELQLREGNTLWSTSVFPMVHPFRMEFEGFDVMPDPYFPEGPGEKEFRFRAHMRNSLQSDWRLAVGLYDEFGDPYVGFEFSTKTYFVPDFVIAFEDSCPAMRCNGKLEYVEIGRAVVETGKESEVKIGVAHEMELTRESYWAAVIFEDGVVVAEAPLFIVEGYNFQYNGFSMYLHNIFPEVEPPFTEFVFSTTFDNYPVKDYALRMVLVGGRGEVVSYIMFSLKEEKGSGS